MKCKVCGLELHFIGAYGTGFEDEVCIDCSMWANKIIWSSSEKDGIWLRN